MLLFPESGPKKNFRVIPSYGVGPNDTLAHAACDSNEICGSICVSLS
jgi:hypothetical protein